MLIHSFCPSLFPSLSCGVVSASNCTCESVSVSLSSSLPLSFSFFFSFVNYCRCTSLQTRLDIIISDKRRRFRRGSSLTTRYVSLEWCRHCGRMSCSIVCKSFCLVLNCSILGGVATSAAVSQCNSSGNVSHTPSAEELRNRHQKKAILSNLKPHMQQLSQLAQAKEAAKRVEDACGTNNSETIRINNHHPSSSSPSSSYHNNNNSSMNDAIPLLCMRQIAA